MIHDQVCSTIFQVNCLHIKHCNYVSDEIRKNGQVYDGQINYLCEGKYNCTIHTNSYIYLADIKTNINNMKNSQKSNLKTMCNKNRK